MIYPATLPLLIIQGATFSCPLEYVDEAGQAIDLSGVTARLQIREEVDAPVVLCELTTENGGLSIDGPAGAIMLTIEPEVSSSFSWRLGVYDLELLWGDGRVDRLCSGSVTVSPEVTRAA